MFHVLYILQIDRTVIAVMGHADLAKYLPKFGDRIALINFCERNNMVNRASKRKSSVLNRLREKLKLKGKATSYLTLT